MEHHEQVIRSEGWGGLYSGLKPSLLGTAASQVSSRIRCSNSRAIIFLPSTLSLISFQFMLLVFYSFIKSIEAIVETGTLRRKYFLQALKTKT